MKLSKTQERALNKLGAVDFANGRFGRWKSAYRLQESRMTLYSLVRRGLAETMSQPGSIFRPRQNIYFRLKKGANNARQKDSH